MKNEDKNQGGNKEEETKNDLLPHPFEGDHALMEYILK